MEKVLKKNKPKRFAFGGVNLKNNIQLTVLSAPALLWFLIFSYIPMLGLIVAFKDYNMSLGIFASPWTGFDNFKFLFSANYAVRILRNTLLYNFASIILTNAVAVAIAIMMESVMSKKCIKFYQTAMFLPRFISWIVVGYMVMVLLDYESGIMNGIITKLGGEQVSWYLEKKYWWMILPVANIWKTMGYSSLVFYGAVMGVDPSLYESARLDGANKWQQIWSITIPMIRTTIIILVIMSIGNILRADFGLFYYVPNNSGALFEVTDVIDTYIYRALREEGDVATSSAAGFFQSVVGFVMIMITNKIVDKVDSQSALF